MRCSDDFERRRSSVSISEACSLLDLENIHAGDVTRMEKDDIGNAPRRILGDISNLVQKPSQLAGTEKMQQTSNTAKDSIDQLKKDKLALQKLIAERSKVDELRMVETRRLKINTQKLQLQNLQLAQANNLMLKELTSAKDMLKIVRHELVCRNGIIAAQTLELKQLKNTMECQIVVKEVGDTSGGLKVGGTNGGLKVGGTNGGLKMGGTSGDEIEHKPSEANSVECQPHLNVKLRSKSLGSSAAQKDNLMEKPRSKRVSLRRKSTRLTHEETEDQFEIHDGDAKLPICSLPDESSDDKKQSSQECNNIGSGDNDTREPRRSSLSRPSRSAATKIQSYKEIPLNKKMRR